MTSSRRSARSTNNITTYNEIDSDDENEKFKSMYELMTSFHEFCSYKSSKNKIHQIWFVYFSMKYKFLKKIKLLKKILINVTVYIYY